MREQASEYGWINKDQTLLFGAGSGKIDIISGLLMTATLGKWNTTGRLHPIKKKKTAQARRDYYPPPDSLKVLGCEERGGGEHKDIHTG